jgi:hypothetical protein
LASAWLTSFFAAYPFPARSELCTPLAASIELVPSVSGLAARNSPPSTSPPPFLGRIRREPMLRRAFSPKCYNAVETDGFFAASKSLRRKASAATAIQ